MTGEGPSLTGWARGVRTGIPRETASEKNGQNADTDRLRVITDRLRPITMHHWRDLNEPDLLDPSIIWISEGGPS